GLLHGRSALQADSPAMLGLRSRRRTRCASFARSAQTTAASQITKRASTRADLSPALLGALQVAPTGYRPPRETLVVFDEPHATVVPARLRAGRRWREWEAPRSAGRRGLPGARERAGAARIVRAP